MTDLNSLFSQFYNKFLGDFQEELQKLIDNDSTDNLLLDLANLKCNVSLKEQLFECVCIDGDNKTISRTEQINRLKNKFGEDYFKNLDFKDANDLLNSINSVIKTFKPDLDINDSLAELANKFLQSNSTEEESIKINEETNPI